MVTHGNIAHNLASIYKHLPQRPAVTMVSWMPQYHGIAAQLSGEAVLVRCLRPRPTAAPYPCKAGLLQRPRCLWL